MNFTKKHAIHGTPYSIAGKVLSLALATAIGLTTCIPLSFAAYTELYREGEKQQISTGVIHENHRVLTNKGWINLNVLRVKLDDPNTALKTLYSETNLSERKALSALTAPVPNVVASINTDFFDTKSKTTLGTIIDGGEYVTTGLNDKKFASFQLTNDLQASIGYLVGSGLKIVKADGTSIPINYKNKPYAAYDRIIMLDKHWGTKSMGNTIIGNPATNTNVTEIVVQNGVVTNMQTNMPPLDIPTDGYVLVCLNKKSTEVQTSIMVGSPLNVVADDAFANLKTVVGGGGILVKDGVVQSKMSTSILGNNPRSALGITKDGKGLILVTIDGRSASYSGVLESELGKIMIDLGAYQVLCLDGGGSTQMMTKDPYNGKLTTANFPSDGGERKIQTGLAVTSVPTTGQLHDLRIKSDDSIGVKDGTRIMTLEGVDSAFQPIKIDQAKVKWSVIGVKAKVAGNRITFLGAGNAKISASYGGKTANLSMNVQANLYKMEILPDKIKAGFGKVVPMTVNGVTKDGYHIKLHPSDLKWTFDSKFGSFTADGAFKAGNLEGETVFKAKFDGIEGSIVVSVGEIVTPLNNFESDMSTSMASPEEFPAIARYELTPAGRDGSLGGMLSYDFTQTDKPRTAAIAFVNGGLDLAGYPAKVGVWVNGTGGNGHELRVKFMDSRGLYFNKTLARSVDWEGWRYLEADLPTNMKAPLKISRIFITEEHPVLQDTGSVIIDDLRSIEYIDKGTVAPATPTKFVAIEKMKHTKAKGDLFTFMNPRSPADTVLQKDSPELASLVASLPKSKNSAVWPLTLTKAYSESVIGNTLHMTLSNPGGYIRKVDYTQWQKLLSLKNRIKSKQILITTTNDLVFEDKLEKELFFKTLETLKQRKGVRQIVIVSPGDVNRIETYRGCQLISVAKDMTLADSKSTAATNGATGAPVTIDPALVPYVTIKNEPNGMTFQLNSIKLK